MLRLQSTAATVWLTLSLHDALPIYGEKRRGGHGTGHHARHAHAGASQTPRPDHSVDSGGHDGSAVARQDGERGYHRLRSEEHTSELQSPCNLVCRLLLEKKQREANT